MSITPDTIGPDGPHLSADSYQQYPLSEMEMLANNRQLRRDLIAMKLRNDELRLVVDGQLATILEQRAQLAEANERAELNHQACLELMGQLEDLRCRTSIQLRIAAVALGAIEGMHQ